MALLRLPLSGRSASGSFPVAFGGPAPPFRAVSARFPVPLVPE